MSASHSFHQATGYDRFAMTPHFLDWEHQPSIYKQYPGARVFPLPEIKKLYDVDLVDAAGDGSGIAADKALSLEDLARILYLANGPTAKARQAGGDFYFRSAPSAGALYPNEIYLIWPGSGDLSSGTYHADAHRNRLTLLRPGNVFTPTAPSHPAALFVITGLFFRSAWKYRARAYRYVLLDAGHVMESLRLAVQAAGFRARLSLAFDDDALNRLLGVDPDREVALGCVALYAGGQHGFQGQNLFPNLETAAADRLPEAVTGASVCSGREIRYPEILGIHRAGTAYHPPSVPGVDITESLGLPKAAPHPALFPTNPAQPSPPPLPYAQAVLKRRSFRNFIRRPIDTSKMAWLSALLTRFSPILPDMDTQDGCDGISPIAVGFLAGNVAGVEPGFWLLGPGGEQARRVFGGNMAPEMAAVCLDQQWTANAGAHFLFMTNLKAIDRRWGARGYRHAMIAAGRLGHAVYLGASALCLGACGVGALYDGEANALLGLNDESALVYLVAVGEVKGRGGQGSVQK